MNKTSLAILALFTVCFTICAGCSDAPPPNVYYFDPSPGAVFETPTKIGIYVYQSGKANSFSVTVSGAKASNYGSSAIAVIPTSNGWYGDGEFSSWALITPDGASQNTGKVNIVLTGYVGIREAWYTYSADYTFKAAKPVFTPKEGLLAEGAAVTITSVTPTAVIHYTTDGTAPNKDSSVYSAPVAISGKQTLKAIALAPGYQDSEMTSADFTGTASEITFAKSCAAWNNAFAERATACFLSNADYLENRAGIVDCETLQKDITAGQMTFEKAQAAACTAAITALPCSSLASTPDFPMPGSACESAIVGKGAKDTACRRNTQCTSRYCTSSTLYSCQNSTCQPRGAAESNCTSRYECEAGLTCNISHQKCEAYGALNQPCSLDSDCGPELRCLELSCQQPKKTGYPCTLSSDCVAGDVCMNYSCKTLVGLGGECVPAAMPGFATGCAAGFFCDASKNTCAALPKVGESCLSAQECIGGYCKMEQSSATCMAYLNVGDACTSNDQCTSLLCSAEKCQARGEFYCYPTI